MNVAEKSDNMRAKVFLGYADWRSLGPVPRTVAVGWWE